jgi:hypothetical protein
MNCNEQHEGSPMNIGACNFPFPAFAGQAAPGNLGYTVPPAIPVPGAARQPLQVTLTTNELGAILAEMDDLRRQLKEARAKVPPVTYGGNGRTVTQNVLLREFAEHVIRTDNSRVTGTPLGVRAKELLEELDGMERGE